MERDAVLFAGGPACGSVEAADLLASGGIPHDDGRSEPQPEKLLAAGHGRGLKDQVGPPKPQRAQPGDRVRRQRVAVEVYRRLLLLSFDRACGDQR